MVIITILNDGCIVSIAYDYVKASHTPEKWHFAEIFTVSIMLGGIAVVSSLLLLYLGLNTEDPDSFLTKTLGLTKLEYDQICTMIYLKVSLSDFLTVFAARTTGLFCSRMPGWQLLIAACVAMGASTALSRYWNEIGLPEMSSLSWKWIAFVWVYCVAWFIIQDVGKIITYWLLYKMNIGSEAHHQGLMAAKQKLHFTRDNRRELSKQSVMKGESLMKASVRMTGKATALTFDGEAEKFAKMSNAEILAELSKLEGKIKALKSALPSPGK